MDILIKKYYEEYNFPKVDKLYKVMKLDSININKKDIQKFLDDQVENQLLKQVTKEKTNKLGSIYAFSENQTWQVDIFFMTKYKKQNNGYSYILCAVDVFTRKAYAVAMKSKDADDCISAFDIIIKNAGVPYVITTDTDSTLTGNLFQKYLLKHDIAHNTVILNDHHSLGIIDRFARTLKTILNAYFIRNDNTIWINILDKVIKQYNNTPHRSLNDIKPKDADKNNEIILGINLWKSKQNKTISDLVKGDSVRLKISGIFKKGTEPSWSDEIYIVKSTNGKTIELTDGSKHKRTSLLKIPNNFNKITKNIIKEATIENKIDRKLKLVGMNPNDIVTTKRVITKNRKYID